MDDEQPTIEKQYQRQGSALSFDANKELGPLHLFFVALKCGSEKAMCVHQQVLATNVPSPIPLLPPWKMLTIRGCHPWRLFDAAT